MLRESAFAHHSWLQKPFTKHYYPKKNLNLITVSVKKMYRVRLWSIKRKLEIALPKKGSKLPLSQNDFVGLYCAKQYMYWKKDCINHSLDVTFDENICERKLSKDRRNLKMVSDLNTAETFKRGALSRNDIWQYLWLKKQHYEDC